MNEEQIETNSNEEIDERTTTREWTHVAYCTMGLALAAVAWIAIVFHKPENPTNWSTNATLLALCGALSFFNYNNEKRKSTLVVGLITTVTAMCLIGLEIMAMIAR